MSDFTAGLCGLSNCMIWRSFCVRILESKDSLMRSSLAFMLLTRFLVALFIALFLFFVIRKQSVWLRWERTASHYARTVPRQANSPKLQPNRSNQGLLQVFCMYFLYSIWSVFGQSQNRLIIETKLRIRTLKKSKKYKDAKAKAIWWFAKITKPKPTRCDIN